MMKAYCVFSILAFCVAVTLGADSVCTKQSLCTCETDKGIIDLTPLSSKKFQSNNGQGQELFEYSPCSDNNTACGNAMVCRSTIMQQHFSIGKSSGESFVDRDNKIAIKYPGDNNKTSFVVLTCVQGDAEKLVLLNETSDGVYVFEFSSGYACPGGPKPASSTTPKSTSKSTKKSTSKTTLSTPKSTKPTTKPTTPKTTKTTPKGGKTTKTTPKTTKTTPKSSKTTPKSSKTTPKNTKTTPKSSKTTPKSSKTTPKSSKTTPKVPVTTHHGAAASNRSFGIAALSCLVLVLRNLF